MLSIQHSSFNRYKAAPSNIFKGAPVSELLKRGDKALNENRFAEALTHYSEASKIEPENAEIYKKTARAQFGLKDYKSAEENFKIYLSEHPDDIDVLIELGETQRLTGFYNKALETFTRAQKLDNKNDLASRSILETKNNMLAVFSPEKAKKEKEEFAAVNLRRALEMTVNYMTPEYMSALKDVKVLFAKTESMGGTQNIAQYENYKQAITVSNSYIYASPQVIAAYLAHESVHAHDNDAYTSVAEEQDAYETAAKFWIKYSNGVKDPEMDYAAELYKQSPDTLKKRVEEIYTLRDPSIAKTSPNHPPKKLFHWRTKEQDAAASHAIKKYDVIA